LVQFVVAVTVTVGTADVVKHMGDEYVVSEPTARTR
jgi:hypothetical protein